MRFLPICFLFVLVSLRSSAQTVEQNYSNALQKLECMLHGSCETDFKEAVFTVENTYFDNTLNREEFELQVQTLAFLAEQLIASRELIYDLEDKEEVEKYAALFNIMTDTLPVAYSDTVMDHIPFYYDFNDIWGYEKWSNMFVTKLLATHTGNCHSMPYLYKILADELNADAHIAVAPNHFYIKHQCKGSGWFNTELTSGMFPIDAWLMASGYVHLDGIVNRLYMEALDDRQSIALCVIDLAKGYEDRMGSATKLDFMMKCCDVALSTYPHYINGLLLKAETQKRQFDAIMRKHEVTYASEILWLREAKELYAEMTSTYATIHRLGYRLMPEEMYLQWLVSLKEEKSRFEDRTVVRYQNTE